MSGVNRVILVARLGGDPDIRNTKDGRTVANLSVATSETWKDRDGKRQERTEWHKLVAFGKVAEIIEKWLHKGDQAYFEGRLQTDSWTDQDGNKRQATKIHIRDITFLGGREEGGRPQKNAEPPKQQSMDEKYVDDNGTEYPF